MSFANYLLAPVAIVAFTASADDGLSSAYKICMDRSGGVTLNMQECITAETGRHDARLNQNYKAALQTLDAPQQEDLRDAQRAWITFRDSECGFIARLTGGSIDRINGANCMLEMTKTRADTLDDLLKLYLGD